MIRWDDKLWLLTPSEYSELVTVDVKTSTSCLPFIIRSIERER